VPGWLKVREYLGPAPDGRPWVQISPTCENLIRTLPMMVHDEKRPEDIDPDCEDHAPEAMRYGATKLREVPRSISSPYLNDYERIFGIEGDRRKFQEIPSTGRGGYG
jgi:hypothetical protein